MPYCFCRGPSYVETLAKKRSRRGPMYRAGTSGRHAAVPEEAWEIGFVGIHNLLWKVCEYRVGINARASMAC